MKHHRLPRTKFTMIFPWFPRPVINLDMEMMLKRPINKKAIINALYQTGIRFIDGIPAKQQRELKGLFKS